MTNETQPASDLLNPQRVVAMAKDSVFVDKEEAERFPEMVLWTEAITARFAFHRERLESHRDEVSRMLAELPDTFREEGPGSGGGWSFLNMAVDRHGNQWTGEHKVMESLLAMAIGLGLAEFCAPRHMWWLLPGGVPYVAIKSNAEMQA